MMIAKHVLGPIFRKHADFGSISQRNTIKSGKNQQAKIPASKNISVLGHKKTLS